MEWLEEANFDYVNTSSRYVDICYLFTFQDSCHPSKFTHVLPPLLVQLFPHGALGTGAQEAAMVDFADSDKEKMRSRKGLRGFSRKKLIFRAKGPELFPSFSEVSASLVLDYYG